MKIFFLAMMFLGTINLYATLKDDFINAAKSGDLDTLEAALKAGVSANVTVQSWWGMGDRTMTALMFASELGHTEIVRRLIRARANVRIREYKGGGHDALGLAVRNGHLEIVKLLLPAKPDLNASQGQVPGDDRDPTALMLATWNGHVEIAQLLIANGAKVNARDPRGYTALMFAEKPEIINLLLAKKANLEAKTKDGDTPLIVASRARKEALSLLIGVNANINARNKQGKTALHEAIAFGSTDCADLLIAAGADVNTADQDGKTPLMESIEKEIHIATLLRKTSKDRYETEYKMEIKRYTETVKRLIEAKADVNAKDKNGVSVLLHATKGENQEIIRMLRNAGAI